MDAKIKLLEYAKNHNTGNILTDEEFIGKMVVEGVCINRTSNSKTIANAKRTGKTIVVTETVISQTTKIVNGKIEFSKDETTTEIFRVEV